MEVAYVNLLGNKKATLISQKFFSFIPKKIYIVINL